MTTDINVGPQEKRCEVYHLEYTPAEDTAKLPYVFSSKFYDSVPLKVLLTDPAGNENHVYVTKIGNRVYFAVGWKQLGDFYDLKDGGWFLMKYASLGKFTIEVENIFGDKIKYPSPLRLKSLTNDYANPIVLDDDEDSLDTVDLSSLIVDRSKFITAVKKFISFDEMTGHSLAFSKSWCDYALPKKDGTISLVDEYGKSWCCFYKTQLPGADLSGLVRGWKTFCREKRLYQGQGATFGVVRPNSNVLYFSPSS